MRSSQFNKWADDAHDVADKAYDAAGKAYGRGRHWFNFTRAQAQEMAQNTAKEARRHSAFKRIAAALPGLQSQMHHLYHSAGDNLGRFRSSIGSGLSHTESTALKLTGIYILVKWFQNRDHDVSDMTERVKAHILEKPVSSALIALSIGYALGRLRK